MKPIDIIILSVIVGIVLLIIGIYVYKRVKKLPTGECSCCKSTTGAKRMFKSIKKELDEEKACNCNNDETCHCKSDD
jgi:Sec-independent protein translocase protein TatA